MKLMKKTIAALALLGITGYSFGYDFGISNISTAPLVVRLKTRTGGYIYNLVQPNGREVFQFTGGDVGLCLESIQVVPFDPSRKYQGSASQYNGKNLEEIKTMGGGVVAGNNYDAFQYLAGQYALQSIEMVMEPKDVYEATVKGAKALLKGLDKLACQALEIAMKSTPEGQGGQEMSDWLTNYLSGSGSGSESLNTLLKDLKAKVQNADGTWKTLPVASAIKLVGDHKTELKDSFSTIEGHLKKGENKEAVGALEAFIKTTSTSIESGAVIQGCVTCDIHTYADTTTSAKEKCGFGLGQIAKASGKLAGNTLCKGREFTIIPTGEKVVKKVGTRTITTTLDEYIAITVTGE